MEQPLIIVYDLNKEETSEDYKNLLKVIRSYDYLKIGKSEYVIYTDDSPDTVWGKINTYVDGNDRLLIIKITNPKQGWLTKEQWDWLNARL